MSSLPHFPSFKVKDNEVSAGIRWRKWLSQFENLMTAMDIKNLTRQKALLLHYAGEEVYDLVETFDDERKSDYSKLKTSLTDYFSPKVNLNYESFKFRKLTQAEGETMDQYHTRLRAQADLCNFQDRDREILSQMIEGITSSKLRRKALRDRLNLSQLLDEARNIELTDRQAEEMESMERIAKTTPRHFKTYDSTNARNPNRNHVSKSEKSKPHQYHSSSSKKSNTHRTVQCRNCGGKFPHPAQKPCPAKGKTCHSCGKQNHFSTVCRSKTTVKQITEPDPTSSGSDDDGQVFALTPGSKGVPTSDIMIGRSNLKFIIDTGASVNIVTEDSYSKLVPRPTLKPNTTKIYGYGSRGCLNNIGSFEAKVQHKGNSLLATFYVIRTEEKAGGNLLSAQTSEDLKIITFLKNIIIPNDLYDGFGKINDVQIKLHIDESVQPIAQSHRRIPYHVRQDVERELRRLEAQDIIEKIDGPTPWVSPIVVVPKKSGGVRLCVDMRQANQAVKRERHPMPTIEELINELNGSKIFSRIDLKQAFHQLELEEGSRFITTFSTHVGLRRYKRLMFGINAAPEIFQKAISDILHDIPGATNFIDDIIVHGPDKKSHDDTLQKTLNRLLERGAKLNKEKCLFGVNKLNFLGHTFGQEGICPQSDKVNAIKKAKPPASVAELRSFLGMTQFLSRYIEGYAAITEPLRLLTKKSQPWFWGNKQNQAFNKLKEKLTDTKVMAYFDPRENTEIIVDASPHGLGSMIVQQGRVVCYASRALTPTESRYSQTEREMLAVVYGVEKFHMYLYGSTFTVITDHKPLLGLIQSSKPCTARIERWRLRLMPYQFTLKYKPGRNENNPADFLSRHPVTQPNRENDGENYIRYIAKASIPNALSLEEVRKATQMDTQLRNVMSAIQLGNWSQNLAPFNLMKDQLSIHDGVVLRQNRIVIPESLRQQVVALAHASHQGMVKTKQLIREKVWFPGIDKMVEDQINKCLSCQAAVTGHKSREPLKMTPLPNHPWDELSIDFAGPFPSGEYLLIVIDDFSRFPEVEIVHSTSSRTTIQRLNQIFARFGIPSIVKSDNGPPFNGSEFSVFAQKTGFAHRKITPLWPEANGEAERFVRTLTKFIHTCEAERSNWKEELPNFLRQYRATPHSSTNISPHEALTGRKMKTLLPVIRHKQNHQAKTHGYESMRDNDKAAKEKQKAYADTHRKTQESRMQIGDTVLVRQPKRNKLTTPYDFNPYVVEDVNGSMITARQGQRRITRNSSYFKPVHSEMPISSDEEEEEGDPVSTEHGSTSTTQRCEQETPTSSLIEQCPSSSHVAEFPSSPPNPSRVPHTQTNTHHYVTQSGRVVKPPNKYTI